MRVYRLYYMHDGQEVVIEKSTDRNYLKERLEYMRTGYLAQFVSLFID